MRIASLTRCTDGVASGRHVFRANSADPDRYQWDSVPRPVHRPCTPPHQAATPRVILPHPAGPLRGHDTTLPGCLTWHGLTRQILP
jgi:hypothetical protein